MSGDIPDGLHTGHWQAVVVPFGCILVDWHIEQIEGFSLERVIISQGVRLHQGPRETMLRTKVAEDWKWNVLIVHNVVDAIGFHFVKDHDVFTGSGRQRDLAPVSSVSRRTRSFESYFADVTYFATCATILTRRCLATKIVADWLRAGLTRNALRNKSMFYWWVA